MYILFSMLSSLLLPVLVVLLIIWLVRRSSKKKTEYVDVGSAPQNSTAKVTVDESSIRFKIANEIRAQLGQYKTAAQKKVVEDMAQTVEYFAHHSYEQASDTKYDVAQSEPALAINSVAPSVTKKVPYETPWKKLQLLDGATILLYLGAFFLLASIGLYVGFGAGTTIKALLVSLLTLLFYGSGIALFKQSKRLKPAGLTFAAIGMATLPIAGAAIYYYALGQTNAGPVWLVVSLLALIMYAHAMYVLRSSLVSYMVVFSSLSIVLSGISSVGLAPYYFIQGIGIAGLLFLIISKMFANNDIGLKEAYQQSSVFLVPFSVGMSVLFVARVGWLQLALSLLVGSLYYGYMAYVAQGKQTVYTLLAQLMLIPSVVSGAYGLTHQGSVVRILLCLIAIVYIFVWLSWVAVRPKTDIVRRQIKGVLLGLPITAVIAFTASIHALWVSVVVLIIASAIVYATDRDSLSGTEFVVGLLALPALVGNLAVNPSMSASNIGFLYLALMAGAVLVRVLNPAKLTSVDCVLQRVVLGFSLVIGALLQVEASNTTQVVVASLEVFLLTLQSWSEPDTASGYALSATLYLFWLSAFFDDAKLLSVMLAGFLVYNVLLTQLKRAGPLHSWYASLSALSLPMIYGLLAVDPHWGSQAMWMSYGAVALGFMLLRSSKRILTTTASTFTYLTAFFITGLYAFSINSHYGLVTSFTISMLLLVSEKIEKSSVYGYLSPLIPLALLLDGRASGKLFLLMFSLVTLISGISIIIRRRRYEAFVAVVGLIVLPWLAGSVVYNWDVSLVCTVYLGLTALLLLGRQLLKQSTLTDVFKPVLQLGYGLALSFGLLYGSLCSWKVMALSYFIAGMLFTAISYVESSPSIITLAFTTGYISILRYTTGLGLSVNQTVSILLFLTQGTYWALVMSKLQTVRAAYARGFQLCVALVIPLIGTGYINRPIFPLALSLFGGMLVREVWKKGQSSREVALLVVHSSLLWWLSALGVREFQVYSQSTAAVLGLFAYWRRTQEDKPSVINQYLWAAVLTFSVPMVWQAISSGNSMYSYLVLVEHVVLIIISIAFRRSTFAWWGIAVVVASVLYQLRKLRYAALAFLGVFIISLAVYFLLRYNKPDQTKK